MKEEDDKKRTTRTRNDDRRGRERLSKEVIITVIKIRL